jgi:PKD repeat protein
MGRASTSSTFFIWNNGTAGTVTAILSVTDQGGFWGSDTFEVHFTPLNCPPIQPSFYVSTDTPCTGQQVWFWDSVLNASNSLTLSWDFGDGTTITSGQQGMGARHTYAAAGTYTATLCVYDSVRNDTACTSQTITVNGNCPQLGVTITGTDTICLFQRSWVQYQAFASNGSGNLQYTWSSTLPLRFQSQNRVWADYAGASPGNHSITVCITDGSGATGCDTIQLFASITNCPPMQLTIGAWPETTCVGRQVQFWDSLMNASGAISYAWDFGDGNTSTQPWGVTHSYTQPGTYTATLCVYDSLRNDTICANQTIVVAANCPQVNGTISGPDTLCIGAPTGTFTANPTSGSSTPQYSYRWQIENRVYFSQTVTHTFSSPGTYGVLLRIIDWTIPDTVFIADTVEVQPGSACLQPLQVAIQGQDSLCAYGFNSTLLSANVSGGTGQYQYSWSDGMGIGSRSPTFFIWNNTMSPGTITVTLDVTDGGIFFGSDTFQIHFTPNSCPPIQPSFFMWPDTPCVGRQVQFWDSVLYSSNSLTLSWDFGDGSTATSSQMGMGATHTYTSAGSYTVTLCVYDSIRNDTGCVSQNIIVNANCPQVGGTITGPDTLCIGAPTGTFTANPTSGSSNPRYSYRWQIENRMYFSQTTTHTFSSPGTYGIVLRIIDWSIPDTVLIVDTVEVQPGNVCLQPLTVDIQGPDSVCLSQSNSVLLNAAVSGGNGLYNYTWSDSRGGFSTRQSYFIWNQSVQTVQVILDVTDTNGQFSGSDTLDIVFTLGGSCPPITPSFGFWPNPACAGQPVSLWDSTGIAGAGLGSLWDMGDGTIYTNSPGQLTHTYTQGGTYLIRYCLIDSANQDTFCTTDSIVVNARCWPQVSADSLIIFPDSVCPGQSLSFFGGYSGGPQFGNLPQFWDFGDGNIAYGSSANHAYSAGGTYTARYCVVDSTYGDTSCLTKIVHILSTCADTVSGYLYHHVNQDGVYNAGEAPLGGYPVTINPGGSMAFADAQGYYEMALAPGTYTVNAANIPNYANTSPASGSYTHTLSGAFTNQQGDFGYDSLLTNHDLDVWLFCSTPRPGFSHWVSVYFNVSFG